MIFYDRGVIGRMSKGPITADKFHGMRLEPFQAYWINVLEKHQFKETDARINVVFFILLDSNLESCYSFQQ